MSSLASERFTRSRCGPNSVAVSVRFSAAAQDDLFDLYRFIAGTAGLSRAAAYIDRIEAACNRLAAFPERGRRREDIRPGLRVIGSERRAAILSQIDADGLEIGRILYGGRDLQALAVEPRD